MRALNPTRRGLLGALAAVPTLGLSTPAASAAVPANGAWRIAFAAYRKAEAAATAYSDAVYKPAFDAFNAKVQTIPHIGAEFVDVTGQRYPMSTADDWAVKTAKRELSRKREWHPDDYDYRDYCQKIVDGIEWREAERKRITAASGITPIYERTEALDEAAYAAFDAAIDAPVTTMGELNEKLDEIVLREGFDVSRWTNALVRDIRRLGGRGDQ